MFCRVSAGVGEGVPEISVPEMVAVWKTQCLRLVALGAISFCGVAGRLLICPNEVLITLHLSLSSALY